MAAPADKENLREIGPKSTTEDSLDHLLWLVRPCDMYLQEFKECKSRRGRWHQYYVHGARFDCADWKKDHDLCSQFYSKGDAAAVEDVIRRELYRMKARKSLAAQNDVWKPRTQPPQDWNSPLPEWKKRQHGLDDKKS